MAITTSTRNSGTETPTGEPPRYRARWGYIMTNRIIAKLLEMQRNEEGGVAAEYGVIIAGVAVVVAVAATALGGRIGTLFDSVL